MVFDEALNKYKLIYFDKKNYNKKISRRNKKYFK